MSLYAVLVVNTVLICCMICCQLISGLHENCRVLLLVLDNGADCIYNGNITHQPVLHGLPQWLFSRPLVRSRPASEADQISLAIVSYQSV